MRGVLRIFSRVSEALRWKVGGREWMTLATKMPLVANLLDANENGSSGGVASERTILETEVRGRGRGLDLSDFISLRLDRVVVRTISQKQI